MYSPVPSRCHSRQGRIHPGASKHIVLAPRCCSSLPDASMSLPSQDYREASQDDILGSDKPTPSAETMSEFAARCLAWYTRSVEKYMLSTVREGGSGEEPRHILVVSHGGCVLTLLTALRDKGAVICREGVEIGYCLNTGVSIVEYTDVPSGGEKPLVGTLVQYSSVEHLTRNNLTPLEVNASVLGDAWWQP